MDFEKNVAYWSKKLSEENERIDPIYTKMCIELYKPLDTEEIYMVREFLVEMKSIGTLLAREVEDYQATPKPKTLIQKLLRK